MAKFIRKKQKPQWINFIRVVAVIVSVQLIFGFAAFSQTFPVAGKVTDAQSNEGIPGQQFM